MVPTSRREVGGFSFRWERRILDADKGGVGGVSGEGFGPTHGNIGNSCRAVRNHYALTVCLHGVESVGKSTLAERLAGHYRTIVVPEYGRAHCESHRTDCHEDDLLLIGEAQQAMIEAARPWCNSAADRGHRCVDDRGMVSDDDRLFA